MDDQPATDPTSARFVPVCAIGASAGGVTALQTLFRLLPDDLGLAYVVVVHLAPDHPSAMHEILGTVTRMPVLQVSDGPTLRANCVYVIPPDRELVIEGDTVRSRPFTDPRGQRAPIDMFFRSVAVGRGDGIAVVLTGAGSDGALGVRAIKEAGGIVMVQEPAEAGFPSMPQNAIATGVADGIAPLSRLAERIAEAAQSKEAVRSLEGEEAANDVRRIVAFLRARTGHDFSGYKRSTVLRRISRRMQVCQILSLSDYASHLRSNPEEAKELLADLLISVTMFFRDPAAFVALNHQVIRPLLQRWSAADEGGELRAWVVGCATGEEAYSLAILFLEEAERTKMHVPIQIFATDLDEGALATAREGRYPRSIEADVTAERLRRFFVDEGTHYRVSRQLRDLILFATHSVVREPPFMRLDLITCRNVLIYLERSLQQHVCAIFHYGLKPDGCLFLGTAETADTSQNQFGTIDRDARIYRALQAEEATLPTLLAGSIASMSRSMPFGGQLPASRFEAGEILGASHASALEASAPPSALVDVDHAVLHLSPTAGRFILLSAGPLAGRLPSIVRPELRLDLKLALDRVFDTGQPTITRLIDVQFDGAIRRTSLHIAPAPTRENASPRAVVYFLDNGPGRPTDQEQAPPLDELRHLHSELKMAQEAELAGRIRHETAVQELRASNEELQSLNEEYRSTAEELETSKEELQSINEELQTVNAELKSKLSIISSAHNDLQNLTASSEIGTLFLDSELRIRMLTPRVAEVVNITEVDVGRPVTNFTHRLDYDGIERDVRQVLRDLSPIEMEIQAHDGRWFLVRIRPYRTLEGQVEGAVVTFDDITGRKAAEAVQNEEFRNTAILRDLSARLVTEDNIQTIYEDILSAAIDITRAQAGTVQMFDVEADELVVLATRGFSRKTEQYFCRVDASSNTSCGLGLRTGSRSFCNFDLASTDVASRMHAEDGVLSAQSSPLVSRSGKPIGMVSTHWSERDHRPSERELRFLDLLVRQAADLVEQRQAEAALRDSEEKYRSVFEGIDEGFCVAELVYDPTGKATDYRLIEVNPAFKRQTGLAHVTGKLGSEVAGTEQHWIDLYADVARTGQTRRLQNYHEPTHRWYDVHVARLGGPSRNRVSVVFSDITERRQAEEALRSSEERLRNVLNSMSEGFALFDQDFTILDVNEETLKLDGRLREELVGRSHWEAFPGTEASALGDFYRRVMRDREAAEGEYRYSWPSGRTMWVDVRAYPTPDGGLAAFWRDITDRKAAAEALKESEERFAHFAASSSDGLWIRDTATLAMEYVSPALGRIYGVPPNAILGDVERWADLIVPRDRDVALSHLEQARQGTATVHEFRIRRPSDDEERWIRDTAFPLRDEAGRVRRIGGIAEEVTDAKRAVERQGVLVNELQHRARNLLGVVIAVAGRTLRSGSPVEAFEERLQALSRAQGLLSQGGSDTVEVGALIRAELAVHADDASGLASISGPKVELTARQVQNFALALHELATNAVKYGALKNGTGRLAVIWEVVRDRRGRRRLAMSWVESGVAVDRQQVTRRGYGMELIQEALIYALEAEVDYDLGPDGARCRIEMPIGEPE